MLWSGGKGKRSTGQKMYDVKTNGLTCKDIDKKARKRISGFFDKNSCKLNS